MINLSPNGSTSPYIYDSPTYAYGGSFYQTDLVSDYATISNDNGQAISSYAEAPGLSQIGTTSGQLLTNITINGSLATRGNVNTWFSSETAFWLSPHTEIILLGRTQGSISSDNGNSEQGQNGGIGGYVSLTTDYVSGEYFSAYADLNPIGRTSFNEQFSLRLSNHSDEAIMGHVMSRFYAAATDSGAIPSPVPEPETYAMMLGGLSILAVLARRRKARQK